MAALLHLSHLRVMVDVPEVFAAIGLLPEVYLVLPVRVWTVLSQVADVAPDLVDDRKTLHHRRKLLTPASRH